MSRAIAEAQMELVAKTAALIGAASICLALAGCQKSAAPAQSGGANTAAAATPATPTAAALASNLPQECQALLAALQSCSDHLTAAHSPVAAQFRATVQQTRETLPAAVSDPQLATSCAASLKKQAEMAHDLSC
jgi:hypothetical protein